MFMRVLHVMQIQWTISDTTSIFAYVFYKVNTVLYVQQTMHVYVSGTTSALHKCYRNLHLCT